MSELTIAGKVFSSRLFTGTGKFKSNQEMGEALAASGSQLVTMALKRVDLNNSDDEILKHLNRQQFNWLPNTSGVRTAKEAVFAAQLAREALETNWVKLEIHPDPKYLMPDPIEIGLCRFTVYSCRPSLGKKITRCRSASRYAIRVANRKQ